MRAFWIIAGFTSLGVGIAGIVLPLVPTVPLILLAGFCFSKSSQRYHDWLLNHKRFGPMIVAWRAGGIIHRPAKWRATGMIGLAFALSILLGAPVYVLVVQVLVLSAALIFIWTRPEGD